MLVVDLCVSEPTVDVFQYNMEGDKQKSGIHKQMEKLVLTPLSTVAVFLLIFSALLYNTMQYNTIITFVERYLRSVQDR